MFAKKYSPSAAGTSLLELYDRVFSIRQLSFCSLPLLLALFQLLSQLLQLGEDAALFCSTLTLFYLKRNRDMLKTHKQTKVGARFSSLSSSTHLFLVIALYIAEGSADGGDLLQCLLQPQAGL